MHRADRAPLTTHCASLSNLNGSGIAYVSGPLACAYCMTMQQCDLHAHVNAGQRASTALCLRTSKGRPTSVGRLLCTTRHRGRRPCQTRSIISRFGGFR